MLRILHDTKIDFIKSWRVAVIATAAFIAAGLIALVIHGGLNRSIEFTGGTLMQLEFAQPPNVADIRSTVDAAGYLGSEIQQFGGPREFTVRAASHASASGAQVVNTATQIKAALERKFGRRQCPRRA
jgi:preprotein translocase subunit SecF